MRNYRVRFGDKIANTTQCVCTCRVPRNGYNFTLHSMHYDNPATRCCRMTQLLGVAG